VCRWRSEEADYFCGLWEVQYVEEAISLTPIVGHVDCEDDIGLAQRFRGIGWLAGPEEREPALVVEPVHESPYPLAEGHPARIGGTGDAGDLRPMRPASSLC